MHSNKGGPDRRMGQKGRSHVQDTIPLLISKLSSYSSKSNKVYVVYIMALITHIV